MKKLALVLGGGATKGFAHIGVLKVLEENGIVPSLIVGTSMGAVVGGVYSSGICLNKIIDISSQFSMKNIRDVSIVSLLKEGNILRGKKIENVIHNLLGDTLAENTKIPFVCCATNLSTGKQVDLRSGLLWKNVLASSAMPAVFPAVEIDGEALFDGGIMDNLPIDVAQKELPKAVVLSVDVIGDYEKQVESGGLKIMTNILNMSTLYMTQISKQKKAKSDLNIKVLQPDVKQMAFDEEAIKLSIEYGRKAMERNIKKLKALLEE